MKTNQKSQKPYAVYVVEGEGEKAYWTKVGAAWAHEDGKGLDELIRRSTDTFRQLAECLVLFDCP